MKSGFRDMRGLVKLTVTTVLITVCLIQQSYYIGICDPLAGSVEEKSYLENKGKTGIVIDKSTGKPIANAQIGIPAKGIYTSSDSNGRFSLNANLNGPAILSVKADGYKPFSLTVANDQLNKPFTIGVTKSSGFEIVIDTNIHHLGDDNFSDESANAGNFKLRSAGPAFTKEFYATNASQGYILKIGSIIGIDTNVAGKLRQSHTRSYSSPTKVYINAREVGQLKINGDNQQIVIPPNYIFQNSKNELTIETGRNLFARNIDYDDMEFMNLSLELR